MINREEERTSPLLYQNKEKDMINFKDGTLNKKEKQYVNIILSDIVDIWGDFYITKDRLRLFIKENTHILWEALEKGDKIIFGEEGILLITGFSDKAERKYIKILSNNEENTDKLLKILNWNITNIDLYAKVKKESYTLKSLQRNGFKFLGDRGKELLLCRVAKKEKQGDN